MNLEGCLGEDRKSDPSHARKPLASVKGGFYPELRWNRGRTMAFKVLFLAHASDADKEKHRSAIDTGVYQLFTVVVRNQAEAIEVCRDFVEKENVDSVLLCPGFTHSDVAEIVKIVGKNVAVSVARGDGPSGRASLAARKREGYLGKR